MLKRILDHFGSAKALAEALNISQSAVSQWQDTGIPPTRAIEIEAITGGKIKAIEIMGHNNNEDQTSEE
jgi:DNA-binding transcriptional regulator YdaS (Cro superfamily)